MTKKKRVVGAGKPAAGRTLWVYGYEMIPPRQEERLTAIRGLLDRENLAAKRSARTWSARLVTEQQATHVLIVSTNAELDLEINRKLEAELKALGGEFVLTVPMPVRDDADPGKT